MSMSINAAGSGSTQGLDPSSNASKIASRLMRDLDPNNSSKVTKDNFVSALTANGVPAADATTMYDAIDTKNTGSITKSDIESAIKRGSLAPPAGGQPTGAERQQRPGNAEGPGGAGGAGAAKGASQPGGAAPAESYDAADTNRDGTVSSEEAAIYALKHPFDESTAGKPTTQVLGKTIDTTA